MVVTGQRERAQSVRSVTKQSEVLGILSAVVAIRKDAVSVAATNSPTGVNVEITLTFVFSLSESTSIRSTSRCTARRSGADLIAFSHSRIVFIEYSSGGSAVAKASISALSAFMRLFRS
ncbi:MAG: hypothetical protein Q4A88_05750 [Clostridia bacterium]|nr:hypothetical protein [Clostridia bacterium]